MGSEMPPPLLSIIISTYNDASNLEITLKSLANLKSIEQEFEVIVIDAASDDNTSDVVQKYSEIIDFFVSEPDHGIYEAWNKALKQHKGRYVSFLGAGDFYTKAGLESMIRAAYMNPAIEFIHARARIYFDDSVRIIGKSWDWLEFRRYMKIVHCGAFHKNTLFDELGEFDDSYKIAGDYDFLLRKGSALKTLYIDEIAIEMAPFGVSQSQNKVFYESMRAKISNGAVSELRALFDMIYALFAHATKKIL